MDHKLLPDFYAGRDEYEVYWLKESTKIHQRGFQLLNENNEYKTSSMIDTYMRHGEYRRRIDRGDLTIVGRTTATSVLESIDYSLCEKGDETLGEGFLEWLAEFYNTFQWAYKINSVLISEVLPTKKMESMYGSLSKLPMITVCEQIKKDFFSDVAKDTAAQKKFK